MPAPKARNRMVVFRLTQEEYEILKRACSERGGRNLSDFTRSELMKLGTDSLSRIIESRFSDMKQGLAELQESISQLTTLVSTARNAGEENA